MTNLKQWHKAVCERDGYKCTSCKRDYSSEYYFQEDVNQYVCGHHVKSQKAHPELVEEVSNGVCVCFECHTKIHKGLIPCPTSTTATELKVEVLASNKIPLPEVRYHTLPNGRKIALGHHEKICKCKKYLVVEATQKCMACEKRSTNFKQEKKRK